MTFTTLATDASLEIAQLQALGRDYVARNWSRGTSSNYSVIIQRDPFRLLITASDKHKELLEVSDFVLVDEQGSPTSDDFPAASAETMLHVTLARDPRVGAVLHTHSIWSTILSDHFFDKGQLLIGGYEMLKGLAGQDTHESQVAIRIVDNTQDIRALAEELGRWRAQGDSSVDHGLLLRGHGLYTWGSSLLEAKRHMEVLEFLFEVIGRKLSF